MQWISRIHHQITNRYNCVHAVVHALIWYINCNVKTSSDMAYIPRFKSFQLVIYKHSWLQPITWPIH